VATFAAKPGTPLPPWVVALLAAETRVRGLDAGAAVDAGGAGGERPGGHWGNEPSYDRKASGSTQFLSRDPLVGLTREPYGYVNDNQLNAVDPRGTDSWWGDPAPHTPDFTVDVASYGFYRIATIRTNPSESGEAQLYIDQHLGLSLIPFSVGHLDGWIGGKDAAKPCASDIDSFVNGLSFEYLATFFTKGGGVVWGNPGKFGKRDFALLQVGLASPQLSLSGGLSGQLYTEAGECGDYNPATKQAGTYHDDGSFTSC
jgi:hypothetical protein